MLAEDIKVRDFLKSKLAHASVGRVLIERPAKDARITIFSARPGVVIGKKGEEIEALKAELRRIMGVQQVHVNIEEIRKPEIDAQLIADSIAQQLEKRIMFRRAMKRAMQNAMRLGAQGIKIMSAGRLNGIEIARTEWYREGRVPLHTLRADIDYGLGEAKTNYGVIGIKVWVYKGESDAQGRGARLRRRRRPRRPPAARGAGRAQAREEAVRRKAGAKRAGRPSRAADGDKKPAAARRQEGRRPRAQDHGEEGEEDRQGRRRRKEGISHAATRTNQVPQAAEGPQHRRRHARQQGVVRRVRPQGHHPRPPHGAPARGRAPRHVAPHQARRPHLDPRVPGQAGVAPSRPRCAWATARATRSTSCARSSRARCIYEMDGVTEALAKEAFALASAKLPFRTIVVQRMLGQ